MLQNSARGCGLSFAVLLLASCHGGPATGDTVTLEPMKDNTLYESATGNLSNGIGDDFFVGQTNQSSDVNQRRGLIAFDVASQVPGTATIQQVTLTLNMSRSISGNADVSLHRLLADWGEGTSNASGQGGSGTLATDGDATWLHTHYPNAFWTTPGGDFESTASATTSVGGIGSYTWGSTPEMVTDVENWLLNPASNFGWLLLGDETTVSSKRFDSREAMNPSSRPMLTIQFSPEVPPRSPDFNMDGMLNCADIDALVQRIANADNDPIYDLNQDGSVNILDLDQWRADAGEVNLGPGKVYLPGDANLSGFVDGSDFGFWNTNKFNNIAAWCSGDFNADGRVDGSDFGIWNTQKFQSSDAHGVAVPEPVVAWGLLTMAAVLSRQRRGGHN